MQRRRRCCPRFGQPVRHRGVRPRRQQRHRQQRHLAQAQPEGVEGPRSLRSLAVRRCLASGLLGRHFQAVDLVDGFPSVTCAGFDRDALMQACPPALHRCPRNRSCVVVASSMRITTWGKMDDGFDTARTARTLACLALVCPGMDGSRGARRHQFRLQMILFVVVFPLGLRLGHGRVKNRCWWVSCCLFRRRNF